jgi:hypothetical protein
MGVGGAMVAVAEGVLGTDRIKVVLVVADMPSPLSLSTYTPVMLVKKSESANIIDIIVVRVRCSLRGNPHPMAATTFGMLKESFVWIDASVMW